MPANKAYVGNLPFSFTEVDLKELFQGFGPVRSAQIILDRETGRSRGFGFVEMETAEALAQAIAGLHERNVQGRNLTVNEARERVPGAAPRSGAGFAPRPGGGGFAPRPGGGGFRPASAPSQSGYQGDSGGSGRGRHERGGERERGERDRGERGGDRSRGRRGRGRGDDSDEGY